MKKVRRLMFLAVLAISSTAIKAGTSDAGPKGIHQLMKNVVAPQAQVIWDTQNHALDAQGSLDGSKMAPKDWNKVAAAAGKIREAVQSVTSATHITVAMPGEKIQDE